MFHIVTTLGSFFNKVHYYCLLKAKEMILQKFNLMFGSNSDLHQAIFNQLLGRKADLSTNKTTKSVCFLLIMRKSRPNIKP